MAVSYTHLRAHETRHDLVCRLLLEKKKTVVVYDPRPSHPYNAGTEYVGFSPTRQTLPAPSAKRREVFGESHEG